MRDNPLSLLTEGRLAPFYHISLRENPTRRCIVIAVEPTLAKTALADLNRMQKKELSCEGAATFIRPDQSFAGWGYGPVVAELAPDEQDWRVFEVELPRGRRVPVDVVWENTPDDLRTMPSDETFTAMNCISGTLSQFLESLCWREEAQRSEGGTATQGLLMKFFASAVATTGGFGSCGLVVCVDNHATSWFSRLSAEGREALARKTLKVMNETNCWILGSQMPQSPIADMDFMTSGANLDEKGRISLRVEGNCACLGPNGSWGFRSDELQELTPHNIDSAAQQLTLLAGIATIWEAWTTRRL